MLSLIHHFFPEGVIHRVHIKIFQSLNMVRIFPDNLISSINFLLIFQKWRRKQITIDVCVIVAITVLTHVERFASPVDTHCCFHSRVALDCKMALPMLIYLFHY